MKRLLAGIVFVCGAAFTVPSAAQPVEYVRVCDAFGTGYYYIPGTEFCLNPHTGLTRWDTEFGAMQAYSRVAQGAAVALAIPTPVIGPNQQFAIAGNYGRVGGVGALGFAFGTRVGPNLTIHAGVGLGLPGMAAGFIGRVQTPDPLFAVGTVMGFNYAW